MVDYVIQSQLYGGYGDEFDDDNNYENGDELGVDQDEVVIILEDCWDVILVYFDMKGLVL